MLAVLCRQAGSIDDLEVTDIEPPRAARGQVTVDVHTCGLNFPDLLIVQGKYQRQPPVPFVPGMEFAGVVAQTGPGVMDVRAGDRVCGSIATGAFAQQLVTASSELARIPDGVSMRTASAVTVAYGTSLYALRDRGSLNADCTLLVLGAGSGVGLAAVEIGAALGARVVAAASSGDKLALAKSAGADQTIHYPAQLTDTDAQKALAAMLKDCAGPRGFDVIFDPLRGHYSKVALRSIAWNGRYLVIGFAAGAIPEIPLNLPLAQAADALRLMAARRAVGKIILQVAR